MKTCKRTPSVRPVPNQEAQRMQQEARLPQAWHHWMLQQMMRALLRRRLVRRCKRLSQHRLLLVRRGKRLSQHRLLHSLNRQREGAPQGTMIQTRPIHLL